MPAPQAPDLLHVSNIGKKFGNFVANDAIDLQLNAGEIHALLGENGAGKSTLIKIIYGALQPSFGEIYWRGKKTVLNGPASARQLGIAMVFQHFSLFEALSVSENIALALPPDTNRDQLTRDIGRISADYGLPLKPHSIIADLSVGERQRVEIVRCLLQSPKLLIMDEPTAVLTPQEAEQLFKTLRRLADEGCAILYISHRLEEVKNLCQKVTILRHGKVVARTEPKNETTTSLARLMVGNDIHAVKPRPPAKIKTPALHLTHLNLPPTGPFSVGLHDINLTVNAGEIVAIAGIAGNGQSELFEVLSGERILSSAAMIELCGKPCGTSSINARRKLGAAFVPEERHGHGAISTFTLSQNILLAHHASDNTLTRFGFLSSRKAQQTMARIRQAFDVRANGDDPHASSLSGGNLQKFIVGRAMDRKPDVLIINQPSWGIDAGAAALIRQAICDLSNNGSAILVISQDLDEIYEIANYIAVISRGTLSPAQPVDRVTREQIGLLMSDSHDSASQSGAS